MRRRLGLVMLAALVASVAGPRAQDEPVYVVGKDVKPPVLVKRVNAVYTKEAIQQRIQGSVLLDVVVRSDGKVGDVTIVKSLDKVYGLDDEAVKAVKQYEFKPGTKDDKPVAVRVQIEITFNLK